MTYTTYSVNDVPIRLTDEKWTHIVENHDDMVGYHFDVLETVANLDGYSRGITMNSGQ